MDEIECCNEFELEQLSYVVVKFVFDIKNWKFDTYKSEIFDD